MMENSTMTPKITLQSLTGCNVPVTFRAIKILLPNEKADNITAVMWSSSTGDDRVTIVNYKRSWELQSKISNLLEDITLTRTRKQYKHL